MSNFWADKLRPSPPPRQSSPVAPAYQPATTRAWWDSTPQDAPQPAPQPYPAQYDRPPPPTKAQHVQQSERCPNPGCGSGNYFTPVNNPRHGPRCFECGYPKLHSTSGVMASTEGGVQKARGGYNGESNYHPEVIVDRA